MSDYSKVYDGASKDANDDVILGADFDTEFSAISTAVATKADKKIPAAAGNVATLSSSGNLQDSGVTSTELAILDGATVTTAELNILDGVTSTTAELNILDGVTVSATEINYLSGLTEPVTDTVAFRGAAVGSTSSQSISNTVSTVVTYTTEYYDTDTIADLGTNNDRVVVPAGVSKVRITGGATFAQNATGDRYMIMKKNGSSNVFSPTTTATGSSLSASGLSISSAVISVSPSEYFTLEVSQNSGGALNVLQAYLSMEIIE